MSWRQQVWADISQRPFSTPELACIALFLGLSCVAAFYLGASKGSSPAYDLELGRIVMIMGPVCGGHLLWFFLLAKALLFPRGPTQPRQSPPDPRVSGASTGAGSC